MTSGRWPARSVVCLPSMTPRKHVVGADDRTVAYRQPHTIEDRLER